MLPEQLGLHCYAVSAHSGELVLEPPLKNSWSRLCKITCNLFIDSAPGAARRNRNEKSKSSNNITSAKRCGNAVPTSLHLCWQVWC